MSAEALNDLFAAARAADPACVGCALLAPGETRPEWLVVDRADDLRVRIDGVSADSPALSAVLALDLSESALRTREVQRLATQSVMAVMSAAARDPFAAGIVALFDLAFTLINNEREARGLPRLQQADLVPLAVAALVARQGAAGAAPGPPP